MYLLAAAMQEVVREGTGQGLKNWIPPETAVAGKTGTTDEQRDAWFAGFTGDRVAVVWLGYDDNRVAKLSGSAAALPIWGELLASLNPEPVEIPKPDGIENVLIDPESGLRADFSCSGAREFPFAQGSAPSGRAPCSSEIGVAVEEVKQKAKGFLERLFGR
jgi:penicillin-binding protein 1B